MPMDEKEFRSAQLEAVLSTAFESAAGMEEDGPLPEDAQAQIQAIASMTPDMIDEDDDEDDEPDDDGDEEEGPDEPATFSAPVFPLGEVKRK